MPLIPFRDPRDPDEKRGEAIWIAISFMVILAAWLAVVLVFGYQPLALGMSYDETGLLAGLGLLLFCLVLYLGAREREERAGNRVLVRRLQGTVTSLDERIEQLRGLCSTSAELAGSLDIHRISWSVLEALLDAVGADTASLVLIDPKTGHEVYADHAPAHGSHVEVNPLDQHAIWEELARNQRNGSLDTTLGPVHGPGPGTIISAPLRLTNGLVGVLGARRRDGKREFARDDAQLLTTLANMAASAMESAYLHAELRESYLSTVRSLANSLDARDNYTAAHAERVATLAVRMAEHLGLSEAQVSDIEVFGPLHDVGKIGIQDSILLKTTPLSDVEQSICREHTIIGERIMRPLKPGQEASAMVRNHHESWDGTGYPDGLAGEEIPLLARLLHVADCYDAMMSDRPYQASMSEQEVLAHFQQYADKHYDPAAVRALRAVARDGAGRLTPAEEPRESRTQAVLAK